MGLSEAKLTVCSPLCALQLQLDYMSLATITVEGEEELQT